MLVRELRREGPETIQLFRMHACSCEQTTRCLRLQPGHSADSTDNRANDAYDKRGERARGKTDGAVERHERVRALRGRRLVSRIELVAREVRAVGADRARAVCERAGRGRADALALNRVPERSRAVRRDLIGRRMSDGAYLRDREGHLLRKRGAAEALDCAGLGLDGVGGSDGQP